MAFVIPSLYSFVQGVQKRQTFEQDLLAKEISNLNNLAVARQNQLSLAASTQAFDDSQLARSAFQSTLDSGGTVNQAILATQTVSPLAAASANAQIAARAENASTIGDISGLLDFESFQNNVGLDLQAPAQGQTLQQALLSPVQQQNQINTDAARSDNQSLILANQSHQEAQLQAQIAASQAQLNQTNALLAAQRRPTPTLPTPAAPTVANTPQLAAPVATGNAFTASGLPSPGQSTIAPSNVTGSNSLFTGLATGSAATNPIAQQFGGGGYFR